MQHMVKNRKVWAVLIALVLVLHTMLGAGIGRVQAEEAVPAGQTVEQEAVSSTEVDVVQEDAQAEAGQTGDQTVVEESSAAKDEETVEEAPASNTETPVVEEVKAPAADAETPAVDAETPAAVEETPAAEEQTPESDVEVPAEEEDTLAADKEAADKEAADKEAAEEEAELAAKAEAVTPVIEENIITSVSITTANGSVIDADHPVNVNDALQLNYQFALPDGKGYGAGSTFEFPVPSQFPIYNAVTEPLIVSDREGETIGELRVTTDRTVKLTFNDYIANHKDVKGNLTIRTVLTETTVSGQEQVEISFPVAGGMVPVIIYVTKPTPPVRDDANIFYKLHTSTNYADKQAAWGIFINKDKLNLNKVVVTDTFPNGGLELVRASLAVEVEGTNADGKGNNQYSAYTGDYDVDVLDNNLRKGFVVTFNGPVTESLRITYTTNYDSKELTDSTVNQGFVNRANLTAEIGGQDGEGPAEQIAKQSQVAFYEPFVNKEGAQNGDRLNWAITINKNQSMIQNARIIDTADNRQTLDRDSFRLYQANVDRNGTVTKTGDVLTEGTDYTLNMAEDGTTGFTLAFNNTINSTYVLEYSSIFNAAEAKDLDEIVNTVRFTGEGIRGGTVESESKIIVRVTTGSGSGSGTIPVTQPPVTEPPVTQPPVTEPPVTQPPVTQPPATQPPVTTIPENPVPVGPPVVTPDTPTPGTPVFTPDTPTPVTPTPGTPTPVTPTPDTTIPDETIPAGPPVVPTEPVTTVPDETIPQGPPVVPTEPVTTVPDETIPQGPPIVPVDTQPMPMQPVPMQPEMMIPDETIPQGPPVITGTVVSSEPMLPQTGEESKLPFVLGGLGLILFGLYLRRSGRMAK